MILWCFQKYKYVFFKRIYFEEKLLRCIFKSRLKDAYIRKIYFEEKLKLKLEITKRKEDFNER